MTATIKALARQPLFTFLAASTRPGLRISLPALAPPSLSCQSAAALHAHANVQAAHRWRFLLQ